MKPVTFGKVQLFVTHSWENIDTSIALKQPLNRDAPGGSAGSRFVLVNQPDKRPTGLQLQLPLSLLKALWTMWRDIYPWPSPFAAFNLRCAVNSSVG